MSCIICVTLIFYTEAYEKALLLVESRVLFCEAGAREIGQAYHALGSVQRNLGNFAAALESYVEALEYYKSDEESSDNEHLSNLYGDIGGVYLDLGEFENALLFLQKDIDMKEEAGTLDVELATAYNNIADLYEQTGLYDIAEKNLLKAIELIKQQLGEKNQYLGSTYNNLANLYHLLGQEEKALDYNCRSIDILTAEFEKHPKLATTYNSKAFILQALGRIDEALQANNIAYDMLLNTIGRENLAMGFVEAMYASHYTQIENYTEAIPYAQRACKIFEKFCKSNNPHLLSVQIYLGEALSFIGEYQSALDVFRQVDQNTDSDCLLRQSFRSALSQIRIHTELNQHEDALHQCVKALRLCQQIGETEETRLLVFDKLLLCYSLSGRNEHDLKQWLQDKFDKNNHIESHLTSKKVHKKRKVKKKPNPNKTISPRFVSVNADPLKLAYVMLTSGLYYNCEFSWLNPEPKQHNSRDFSPADVYIGSTITDKHAITFSDLCQIKDELKVDSFICICALDESDIERINLGYYGSNMTIGIFLDEARPDVKQLTNKIVKELKSKYKKMFP